MKNPRNAWIVYIVLRLLFFAIPFAVLYVIGLQPWIAAIFAALIGVALSVIFLARSRSTASESIYDWRNRDRTADDIVEDEAVEAGAGVEVSAGDAAGVEHESGAHDPQAIPTAAEWEDVVRDDADSAESADDAVAGADPAPRTPDAPR